MQNHNSRDSETAGVDEEKDANLEYNYVLSNQATESELLLNYGSIAGVYLIEF